MKNAETNQVAAVMLRGNSIENSYLAHVAVVNIKGKVIYEFGDPTRITLARSASKPAQALAILETGAFERFSFDEADLALMCASHSSEARHIERAIEMLAKAAVSESDMRCGGHPALSESVNRSWIKNDFIPGPVCSNCSGKHIGMLAAAKAIDSPVADYHLPDHPLQTHVKRTIADVCDLTDAEIEWAIDGCNLPTPAFRLDRLALLYAKLAAAEDCVVSEAGVHKDPRTHSLAKIFRAMTHYPELVAGEGRFCTEIMEAFGGRLVGKLGADATYAIGIRASSDTLQLGTNEAIGISIKVEDGNIKMLYAIVCEVLRQLGIGSMSEHEKLLAFHHPQLCNTMNIETSHLIFPLVMR
jgi:L-asparaginase II